jgi:UDP-N-acetylglucosamine--N-acetylmuramyl-(pentapeptide) pyrophosphoryl-undecaprenol N-acetylglucosamine transferase
MNLAPLTAPSFIFAGGGSGGHISPGLAIAERLVDIEPQAKPLFVCSNRSIDATMLRDAGVEFFPVSATPPSSQPVAACRFLWNFRKSKRAVMRLIRERNVNRIITLGGFVAAPAVSAANACRVPVLVVNLDTPPGRANLWMAKRSDEVISAIELPSMPHFASRVVGMPIRKRALAPGDSRTCRARLGLSPEKYTLLVTGASQGATSINTLMIELANSSPGLFLGWQVYHLAGHGCDEPVRNAYMQAGVDAKVEPFMNEMGLAWGAADLAVSRAGASSVAEAAHNAVPTLFLPYPHHQDMHQRHNAQPLVELGGAMLETDHIEPKVNAEQLRPVFKRLMDEAKVRETMRACLKSHEIVDAARTIAQMILVAE